LVALERLVRFFRRMALGGAIVVVAGICVGILGGGPPLVAFFCAPALLMTGVGLREKKRGDRTLSEVRQRLSLQSKAAGQATTSEQPLGWAPAPPGPETARLRATGRRALRSTGVVACALALLCVVMAVVTGMNHGPISTPHDPHLLLSVAFAVLFFGLVLAAVLLLVVAAVKYQQAADVQKSRRRH
jgi:hypothetical protein